MGFLICLTCFNKQFVLYVVLSEKFGCIISIKKVQRNRNYYTNYITTCVTVTKFLRNIIQNSNLFLLLCTFVWNQLIPIIGNYVINSSQYTYVRIRTHQKFKRRQFLKVCFHKLEFFVNKIKFLIKLNKSFQLNFV